MMPLTMAAANEINYIKKVGGNSEVKRHLETLGFVAGGEVPTEGPGIWREN